MSAVIDHGHDDHGYQPSGLMRWITTTNHKDIGTLYLWFSFIMFMTGGAMVLVVYALRPNLERLRNGTEKRITPPTLRGKAKQQS